MAKIQISKIILRSGPASDLPGSPISTSPLMFSKGLDVAEMAFITDTGRIYIGHDPKTGQPQYDRIIYPYQNIEVLTENSVDTLETMVGSALRDNNEKSFYHSNLPTHQTDWEKVIVPRAGDPNYNYRISFGDNVSATIDYAVFDINNKPVKFGSLSVRYFDGEDEPKVIDESSAIRRLDLTNPDASNPSKAFSYIDFNFTVEGAINSRYLSFEYNNNTNDVLQLRFKTTRPKV